MRLPAQHDARRVNSPSCATPNPKDSVGQTDTVVWFWGMARQSLIAVVDDEAPVRTMLGRLLRLDGYEVVSFGCGEEFIASLAGRKPDCVLLDIHLPNLSGFDVQARLQAMGAGIPVIFITASDDPALSRKVEEAKGVKLLRKPFSSRELSGAVHALLSAHPRDMS